MNTHTIVAALFAAMLGSAAMAAQAQDGQQQPAAARADAGTSPRSRADVMAELDAARRAGELDHRTYSYGLHARDNVKSMKTREEVVAELVEARMANARLAQQAR